MKYKSFITKSAALALTLAFVTSTIVCGATTAKSSPVTTTTESTETTTNSAFNGNKGGEKDLKEKPNGDMQPPADGEEPPEKPDGDNAPEPPTGDDMSERPTGEEPPTGENGIPEKPENDTKAEKPTETTTASTSSSFTDITDKYSWASEAINSLYKAGIVSGTGNNQYSPAATIKRGDFVIMVVKLLGLTSDSANTNDFSDVAKGSYYESAITTAKNLGIITETGTFRPNEAITREEAIDILYRALKLKGLVTNDSTDISSFSDCSSLSDTSKKAIATLSSMKIISGYNGKFNPASTLTRAEVAVVLHNSPTE